MYPDELFLGLHLYDICMILGILLGLSYFRFYGDKCEMETPVQNTVVVSATLAVFGGYYSSVLFQGFYNFLESGAFELNESTGSTFYGGLIGGVIVFFLCYFLLGRALFRIDPKQHLAEVVNLGFPAVAFAHAIGRLGCLFAGCCHGAVTDSWIGIWNESVGAKTVPVPLFETVVLLALVVFMSIRISLEKKKYNVTIYLCGYAVWRFFAEYLRTDDRGATVVAFLTPSQLTAVLLFVIGILLGFVIKKKCYDEKEN